MLWQFASSYINSGIGRIFGALCTAPSTSLQGDEAFVKQDYAAAYQAYSSSLRHDTSSAAVWANRAATLLRLGECGIGNGSQAWLKPSLLIVLETWHKLSSCVGQQSGNPFETRRLRALKLAPAWLKPFWPRVTHMPSSSKECPCVC